MAGSAGPTVKLTFAGDASSLDKTMTSVGDSADTMSKRVGGSSKNMHDGFDKVGERFDNLDTKAMGFRDSLTGVQDTSLGLSEIMKGNLFEGFLTLGAGLGDLGSAFYNLIIPSLKTMWTVLATNVIPAVWSFTAALLANPITWIVIGIIALIAAIVLMITHWNKVKEVVSNVVRWIKDRWDDATGWLGNIAGKIGGFFSGMWDGMKAGAKAALNWVIDRLNDAVKALNFLIKGINYIPGVSIPYIPLIPKLHQGGVVPGVAGSEMLAVLQAGERVIPATGPKGGSGGGSVTVTFKGNSDAAFAAAFMGLVRSGDIQLAAA